MTISSRASYILSCCSIAVTLLASNAKSADRPPQNGISIVGPVTAIGGGRVTIKNEFIEQLTNVQADRIAQHAAKALKRGQKDVWIAAVRQELAPLVRAGQDIAEIERTLISMGETLPPGESYVRRIASLLDELVRSRLEGLSETMDPQVRRLLDMYRERLDNDAVRVDDFILSEVQRLKLANSQIQRRRAASAQSAALKAKHEAGWVAIERGKGADDRSTAIVRFEEAHAIFSELLAEEPTNFVWKRSLYVATLLLEDDASHIQQKRQARIPSVREQASILSEEISYRAWVAADWNEELFYSHHSQADIEYLKGNLNDANRMYRRALGSADTDMKNDPIDIDRILNVINLQLKVGDMESGQTHFLEAGIAYREVIRLATLPTNTPLTRSALREAKVTAYGRLVTVFDKLGNIPSSTQASAEALSLIDEEMVKAPEAPEPKLLAALFLVRSLRISPRTCISAHMQANRLISELPEGLRESQRAKDIAREAQFRCPQK